MNPGKTSAPGRHRDASAIVRGNAGYDSHRLLHPRRRARRLRRNRHRAPGRARFRRNTGAAAGRRRRRARAASLPARGQLLPARRRTCRRRAGCRAGHPDRLRQPAAARWLELNPTSEQARRHAGVAALQLHRLDAADAHFAVLLETAYLSPAAGFLALYPVIADEGTPADVTELFQRLSARHPKVAEGQYALAGAALRSENYALAVESATRATQLAPYWVPARMLRARTLIANGQDEQGLALALEVVNDNEADVATHLEYALLLSSTGHDEEARAMLTPYASGTTVVPGALRALGLMDLQQGDLDSASKRFDALLSTGAQTYESLFHLGAIAEQREDADRALRNYARVTGGDFALPAQVRVARIKADKSGTEAGLLHLEEFARARP